MRRKQLRGNRIGWSRWWCGGYEPTPEIKRIVNFTQKTNRRKYEISNSCRVDHTATIAMEYLFMMFNVMLLLIQRTLNIRHGHGNATTNATTTTTNKSSASGPKINVQRVSIHSAYLLELGK